MLMGGWKRLVDTSILMFEFLNFSDVEVKCAARPCPLLTRKAVSMPVSLKSGWFCGKSEVWFDSKQEEQRSGRPDREGGKCKIKTLGTPR